MIAEFTVSMFSGYMGPRASKNAVTVNSAIAGTEKIFQFGSILAHFPIQKRSLAFEDQ